MIPLINMQLGEIIIGGVGAGLYGMLLFVIIAMFVAGLMVGRTPEYLGKKIEAKEVKMAMLAILCLPLDDARLDGGGDGRAAARSRPRPTRARTASPRSSTPTPRRPATTARPSPASRATPSSTISPARVAMLVGRFFVIIPAMAIAGSLAAKKTLPASAGTFPTDGGLFVGLLVGVILIVGGLTFFPALALGPVVEHLAMIAGRPSF